jgi:DNA replication and repair protein RecF
VPKPSRDGSRRAWLGGSPRGIAPRSVALLIRRLRVRGWRNLADERLDLAERVTVLFGKNGQGKSNLLEAAYYAITFRSFRTSSTADLVMWGAPVADVEAGVTLRGLERDLRVKLAPGKKSTTLDGKGVRRDSDSLDGAAVVIFGPDDLRLPKAPAVERRRALDRAVFAVHRGYFREAQAFERALKARNGLLRRGEWSRDLLESYDETLAVTGARIVLRRRELVGSLAPRFREAFAAIHGDLPASIHYRSDAAVEAAVTELTIGEAIRRGLEAHRGVDQRRGFSGFGPHTDDLEILLGDRLAREHGSQGQIRSLMLAFKFAELRHVEERNRETPLLLLDDVASELDEERRARLFETISVTACQTLLTVTEAGLLPDLPGRVDWRVRAGHLEPP